MKKRVVREMFLASLTGSLVVYLAVAAGGCAGSGSRRVNVSEGQYYTEDEYAELSSGKKRDYCADLDQELSAAQQGFEDRQEQLAHTKLEIEKTRQEIVPLDREILELESDIRTLKDQIRDVRSMPTEWRVRPDESLSIIAGHENIYNDIDKWWKIFEANQDKIQDPYYIFPDTVLVIPRDWPTE